jgi:hypothetical protein
VGLLGGAVEAVTVALLRYVWKQARKNGGMFGCSRPKEPGQIFWR